MSSGLPRGPREAILGAVDRSERAGGMAGRSVHGRASVRAVDRDPEPAVVCCEVEDHDGLHGEFPSIKAFQRSASSQVLKLA